MWNQVRTKSDISETGVKMFKLYFVFNLVCIYLAIKSAFSAEVPDPNVILGHYLDWIL